MYNPFDENNTTNNAKDNEPLEQDTAKEEEPVNASQPESPASPEYHYTGSEVKDRAPSEQQTTYTASGYGQQPGSYSGQGQQSPYPTQTGWQYGNQPQAANTYTWNGQQSNVPAYTPVQPKPKKHRDGKKAKKVALRVVAAVLCCAVVSFASVGIFAAMIQTGFINIENTGSGETAAFTLYRQADDSGDTSSNVVTTDSLSRQEAAQKVIPSVVCIQNYQITTQGFFFSNSGGDSDSAGSLAGEGSGIIISEDGYIVTNQHVVDGASKLEVVTSDGASYEATLVGEDTQTDLAVIKIEATGLTAAEYAARAGHHVTLYEAQRELGGILRYTDHVSDKADICRWYHHVIQRLPALGVEIVTGTAAEPDHLKQAAADAILVAMGGRERHMDAPISPEANYMTAMQAHLHPDQVRGKTVVVGGGTTGCELAIELRKRGLDVTLVSRSKVLMKTVRPRRPADGTADTHLIWLDVLKPIVLKGWACTEVGADTVEVTETGTGVRRTLPADTVIDASGIEADPAAARRFHGCAPQVLVIGDSAGGGLIADATRSAYDAVCLLA